MAKKTKEELDVSAEEKIKEAARKVFTLKGYAATRTRDIAEASGINLALLNYYFRSKEKLFHVIMIEKIQKLFGVIIPIANDTNLALEIKIELIVTNYIDLLLEHPDLPLFVFSEVRNNTEQFIHSTNADNLLRNSSLIKQIELKKPDINPLHFLMSLLGMVVFPFIGKPVFTAAGILDEEIFQKLMNERKALIPKWIKSMLELEL
ncbi:TetR/AcrR family transcriptional regulator [Arcticibacter eurypsychrophilus]|uniref:TetR/AcrR family transcriptional regulator n=1 Tax=Arcticibacter eurypsychrophilus TaxID=1434752 RepID=UPI00084D9AB7|nr:TetR/AcrR family transcriptional regulator [Arcticibacter eurypsychrophilus]